MLLLIWYRAAGAAVWTGTPLSPDTSSKEFPWQWETESLQCGLYFLPVGHAWNTSRGRRLMQTPKPPQLGPVDEEQQQLCVELLSLSLPGQTHFGQLFLASCSCDNVNSAIISAIFIDSYSFWIIARELNQHRSWLFSFEGGQRIVPSLWLECVWLLVSVKDQCSCK